MSECRDPLLPLHGLTAIISNGRHIPGGICAEHLSLLGASVRIERGDATLAGALTLRSSDSGDTIGCSIPWLDSPLPATDGTIQALSGLIGVHSLDRGVPARLGLEVASVAAGIIATQGILAGLIAQCRGQRVQTVTTSVLAGALAFLRHHLAIATCGGSFPFCAPKEGQRPPFSTSDGHWVEIEVLSGDAWKAFWTKLGVNPVDEAGKAWLPYVYRYLAGRCALPAALHKATQRHSLAELQRCAEEFGIALCRVRTYQDLFAEPGWSPEAAPWIIRAAEERRPHRSPLATNPEGPLSGLRVVEVTSRLQGPLAGLLLSLLGAEVIKIEPPGGDFGKHSPPLAGSIGAAYLAYNRGKRCVEIDYKPSEGRAQLREWIAGADVFIHNWRMGRAEQLGLDATNLLRLNPGLVYAHASGWGSGDSEPCPIAGDFLVQAHAACGDGLNPSGEPPFPSPLTLVDVTGGLLACEGILAGLYARELTGHGCRVETSLLGGAKSLQAPVLRAIAGRNGKRKPHNALDQPIATADGFLVVEDCEEVRDRFARIVDSSFIDQLGSRTAREWEALLLNAGIAAAEVRTDLRSLPSDPRFAGLVERAQDACWLPAAPWRFAT